MSERKQTPNLMSKLSGLKVTSPDAVEPDQDPPTLPMPETKKGKKAILRKARQVSLDLTPEMKSNLQTKSTELGIPVSQLALFLLTDAWERLENGEIDPTPYLHPSTSPKFRNNLIIPDWVLS